MKNLAEHVFGIALAVPRRDHPFEHQPRKVAAEHDPVLQTTSDFLLERRCEVLWSPAVEFVVDVALVQEHGDHIVLPRIGRAGRKYIQLRESRRHSVDVARMAMIEKDAFSSSMPLTDAGETTKEHYRNAEVD